MDSKKPKIVCIVGANASGKSSLGVSLSLALGGEVISADSRQVYQGLDLGSGKITPEEMQDVPHKMIDVVPPKQIYSLFEYQRDAYLAIDEIAKRGKRPFLVGGTGLYINAIAEGYQLIDVPPDLERRMFLEEQSAEELASTLHALQPDALQVVDCKNPRRLIRAIEIASAGYSVMDARRKVPRYAVQKVGVLWDRDRLRQRIKERMKTRFDQGMIEEVEALLEQGVSKQFMIDIGLEYRFITQYLAGDFQSFEDFSEKLFFAICQFAKRQYTWFRKDKSIQWFAGDQLVVQDVSEYLQKLDFGFVNS